tara:strand:- start:100 stop:1884 length:1785 start_codon:yes stop_codon:yes gene_type:complete
MAALTSALNSLDNMQIGENNSIEYGWSLEVQEMIVQLQFQLTRCDDNQLINLKLKFIQILERIFDNYLICKNNELIKIIYKIIAHTRDIKNGKGEYNLSYMLLDELYKISKNKKYKSISVNIEKLSFEMLKEFVNKKYDHPYGSWKDIKYILNYRTDVKCRNFGLTNRDSFYIEALNIICEQLKKDTKNKNNLSLVAKWIPREKSDKFGWIAKDIAFTYYKEWLVNNNVNDYAKNKSSERKALTHFRQLISSLNKDLHTPQINQCNKTWSNIDFNKNVTSITLQKQRNAFQGVNKQGKIRMDIQGDNDRLLCRENFIKYINDCRMGKSVAKGKCIGISSFVKDALYCISQNCYNKEEYDLINMQWNNNASYNNKLCDMIAMVDTSASMEVDNSYPINSAIGLGLRIAESSKLGKRILTFNSKPEWVNLENCNNFIEMVRKVKNSPWGMNTNFDVAFDLILSVAVANNISPQDMENFTLVILSDMQIDSAANNSDSMYERMRQKYYDAGLKTIYKTPYKLPHIVFWNLRSTNGFPNLSNTPNTSMLSSNSPALLNNFSENGISVLKNLTPWNIMKEQLSISRYDSLNTIVDELFL